MKSRFFHTTLAILLTFSFIAPPVFFVAPKNAHAFKSVVTDPTDMPFDITSAMKNMIIAIHTSISSVAAVTSGAALIALKINAFVLEPLAFVLSGNLLKTMAAGTIAFVIGKANATGVPQFVADIQTSFQTVSDVHALAYFNEYIRSSRSPWNTAIISQLSKEYLNKTSLEGFWAQNMDTLRRTSPNIGGFLMGNWAAGGVRTWFALTTQTQNNPFMLYADAQRQLGALIGPGPGGATGAHAMDMSAGNGFVSWCGPTDGFLGSMTTGRASGAAAIAVDKAVNDAYDKAYNDAMAAGNEDEAVNLAKAASKEAYTTAFAKAKAANVGNTVLGVNPGDPCTNADGTTGTIQTPASTIAASLDKVLGGQQDNVVRMGNVGPQITQILDNFAEVLKTVQFASKILGGQGSGGLLGVDEPTPEQTRTALSQFAELTTGNLGVTESDVFIDAAGQDFSGPAMLKRVAEYESAVNIMRPAANAASTNIANLMSYCTAQQEIASSTLESLLASPSPSVHGSIPDPRSLDIANLRNFILVSTNQISAAQTAFATIVAPVITRIDAAPDIIAKARTMVDKIQTGLTSGTGTTGTIYMADLKTLQTMPPTLNDLAVAQQDSTTGLGTVATADPDGSLNVSSPLLIDRLNLLSTNAVALRPVCTAPTPTPMFGTTSTL